MPTVTTITCDKAWPSSTANVFGPVPCLSLALTTAHAGPAAITWSLAVPMNGGIVTRLNVDGKAIPSTTVVVGNTTYATSTGSYYTTLSAGAHTVVLEYRTNMNFTFDPMADWQGARLQMMSFDQ
jgi:hypothetical protein